MLRSLAGLAAALVLFGCGDDSATPDGGGVDAGLDAGTLDAGADAAMGCDAGPPVDGGGELAYTETREPCADRNPLRNLYFGDLHVHTSLSFDSAAVGNTATLDDAYRFARGEAIQIFGGAAPRSVQLTRPLDFAAVTDHAEFLAEVDVCLDPTAVGYESETCTTYRMGGATGYAALGVRLSLPGSRRDREVCGTDLTDCTERISPIWQTVRDAAERHYDRTSACTFTTFVAYEHSPAPGGDMMHRNVIFRNESVPPQPISAFEAPGAVELYRGLSGACTLCGGCDALVIPHNSNQSAGGIFGLAEIAGMDDAGARAFLETRRAYEQVVELMQHKGSSECRPESVLVPDEECGFEVTRYGIVGTLLGAGPLEPCNGDGSGTGNACWAKSDYVRNTLVEGLRLEAERGVNPFELGFIGSTDTHNGTPGATDEIGFRGHVASQDFAELSFVENSPGGLAAVWAVENGRDAIFEALRRREVYATSGPRIALRFFGARGWDASLCADARLVERGYEEGVPMGGTLPAGDDPPTFVVSAMRDQIPLARVQIVKLWLDATGEPREAVYDAASPGDPAADADPDTCEPTGDGADSACVVWEDPDHDPALPAVYYARVLENPTCRWSARQCIAIPVAERPEECSDPDVPRTIRERAWSSPIWVEAR